MAIRNIRISTDEVLRKTCKPIKEITPNLLTLLDDMADTMYEANGVGLAAPQVGILKRAVVIDIGEGLVELLNPVILETSGSQTDEEGCLSLPGQSAPVERPYYVKAKAMDREGSQFVFLQKYRKPPVQVQGRLRNPFCRWLLQRLFQWHWRFC